MGLQNPQMWGQYCASRHAERLRIDIAAHAAWHSPAVPFSKECGAAVSAAITKERGASPLKRRFGL